MNKYFLILLLALLTSGCLTTKPDMHPKLGQVVLAKEDSFKLEKADNLDAIVVMAGIETGKYANESKEYAKLLQKSFSDRGIVIAERELTDSVKKEIQFSSAMTDESYNGPKEASKAALVTIDAVTVGSNYTPRKSWTDKKGKYHTSDAYCSYKLEFSGKVEIKKLPEMELVQQFSIQDDTIQTQSNPSSSSCRLTDGIVGGLLIESFNDSINYGDQVNGLNTLLAPRHQVTGAFELNGNIFFETNIGLSNGAKDNRKVSLYKELDGQLLQIGEGEFVDTKYADQNSSFIAIDKDLHALIKVGTIVKLSEDECSWTDFKCLGSKIKKSFD